MSRFPASTKLSRWREKSGERGREEERDRICSGICQLMKLVSSSQDTRDAASCSSRIAIAGVAVAIGVA